MVSGSQEHMFALEHHQSLMSERTVLMQSLLAPGRFSTMRFRLTPFGMKFTGTMLTGISHFTMVVCNRPHATFVAAVLMHQHSCATAQRDRPVSGFAQELHHPLHRLQALQVVPVTLACRTMKRQAQLHKACRASRQLHSPRLPAGQLGALLVQWLSLRPRAPQQQSSAFPLQTHLLRLAGLHFPCLLGPGVTCMQLWIACLRGNICCQVERYRLFHGHRVNCQIFLVLHPPLVPHIQFDLPHFGCDPGCCCILCRQTARRGQRAATHVPLQTGAAASGDVSSVPTVRRSSRLR